MMIINYGDVDDNDEYDYASDDDVDDDDNRKKICFTLLNFTVCHY